MDLNKRLEELQAKETLTDSEMNELMNLSPPNTFKSLPNLLFIGVVDAERAAYNLKEGPERAKNALNNKCYLEVISLRLQHAEFWLRMFWVAKNKKGRIFEPEDKRTFGAIINDCKQLGFPPALIKHLLDFNEKRIDAIHKYLLGATGYDKLSDVCKDFYGLDGEISEYVRNEIGLPI